MAKFHLSVNGPNRELFGVQTEDEPYAHFVAAVQEAGLDEVLEQLSRGTARQVQAVGVAQAAFPGAQVVQPQQGQVAPWDQVPQPAYAPPPFAGPPVAPQFQQAPQMPAAATPQGVQPEVKNGACIHGQAQYREAPPGSGKTWKAYFCPTPKGTPNQCKAEFLR